MLVGVDVDVHLKKRKRNNIWKTLQKRWKYVLSKPDLGEIYYSEKGMCFEQSFSNGPSWNSHNMDEIKRDFKSSLV